MVVLQASDCGGANSTQITASSLGKTLIGSDLGISTHTNMTDAVLLRVCYATQESLGDAPTDFAVIGTGFRQTKFSFTV